MSVHLLQYANIHYALFKYSGNIDLKKEKVTWNSSVVLLGLACYIDYKIVVTDLVYGWLVIYEIVYFFALSTSGVEKSLYGRYYILGSV